MSDLILHHYERSPFSEKIRLIYGIKSLPWRSVEIPPIMPKPDYVALTGGYRRTPAMQIGADIYCDTQRIVAELEHRHPEPSLFEVGGKGLNTTIAMWADKILFWPAVRYTIGVYADAFGPEFHADRAAMRGAEPNVDLIKAAAGAFLEQLTPQLAWVEDMLSRGTAYLLGDKPGLADLAVYHCLWFLQRGPETAKQLQPYTKINAWMDRMKTFGHGEPTPLDSSAAIEAAKSAEPEPIGDAGTAPEGGPQIGDAVKIASDDNVPPAVDGTLVAYTADEIAIRRNAEDIGDIVVHFPRPGYLVKPA